MQLDGEQLPMVARAYLPMAVRTFAVPPPPPTTLIEVGQFGGRASDIVVIDRLAYLALGAHMVILDVSAPTAPTLVGQTDVLPGLVHAVAVRDGMAYLAVDSPGINLVGGLFLYDVRVPSSPRRTGSLRMDSGVVDVEIGAGYAYVFANDTGMRGLVVDVRDPARPRIVGDADFVPPWAPARPGGYLVEDSLLIAAYGGVYALDDPAIPRYIASIYGERNSAIAAEGGLVAVADPGTWRLTLYDLTVPAQPRRLADVDLWQSLRDGQGITGDLSGGGLQGLALRGHTLIVSGTAENDWGGLSGLLAVVDVSDWARPRLGRALTYDCNAGMQGADCVAVQGLAVGLTDSRAIVATARSLTGQFRDSDSFAGQGGGLVIFDLTGDAAPGLVGAWRGPSAPEVIAAGSRPALFTLTDGPGGGSLEILDLAIPARPVLASAVWRSQLSISGSTTPPCGYWHYGAAAADGDHLWLAQLGGIRVVDATDLAAPRVGGAILADRIGAYPYALTVSDGVLFHLECGMLVAHDISNPDRPRAIGRAAVDDDSDWLVVTDGYAYVAGTRQVRVLDVRDASAMGEVNRLEVEGDLVGLVRIGSSLAVLTYHVDRRQADLVLTVYGLTDRAHPRPVGAVSVGPAWGYGMVAAAGSVFVLTEVGVKEVDVRNPAAPALGVTRGPPSWLCGTTPAGCPMLGGAFDNYALSAHVVGGHVYVAYGDHGATVFEVAARDDGT